MAFPGPDVLGRGVVVSADGESPLRGAERVVIDHAVLSTRSVLEETVDRLHRTWAQRRPVTVELRVEVSELRQPVVEKQDPWKLGPGYLPGLERLHYLVWANNWDGRGENPVWWWSAKAGRLGAQAGGRADIILPGGEQAWVDGGPRASLDLPVVHCQTVEQGRLLLQPPARGSRADLADDQQAAVEHPFGPVRVIAPAGSGKTRTLGARLLHLVDDRGVEPGIVTTVAYNKRAAEELRQRLQRDDLHIRTIHALGWAIIRDVRPDATHLDERAVRSRLAGMIPRRPRPNTDIIGPYLEGLAEIRMALRDPVEVEGGRNDAEGLAEIFPRYRALLRNRNEIDFDEQIYGAVELLLADPDLRRRWQKRCQHLLVDEFQDLTPAYLLLLRLLASPGLNVFGVGDDDQTIYGYAGADPRFLIEFDRYFPGAGSAGLTINYRCPSEVVTAASHLLSHNRIRVPKTIKAASAPELGSLRIITPALPQLAVEATEPIGEWLKEGAPPGEIAILARVNSALLPALAALERTGIPFRSRLDPGLLNRTTIRAARAWIRLALRPESMTKRDLMEAVRRPARRITRLAYDLIPDQGLALSDLAAVGKGLDERRASNWTKFVDAIEEGAQVAARDDSGRFLDYLAREVGLGRAAGALDSGRSRVDRSTHTDDLVALRRTAAVYQRLATFEDKLRNLLRAKASPDSGVMATTIHRVKGLEWDRVVVFGADAGLMPHVLAEDPEEERRIFHVAITRGRQQVVVVAEKGRESPFLREMTEKFRPQPRRRPGHRLVPPVPGAEQTESDSPRESVLPYDEALYEALRQWRLEVARETKVSAFIIFYNRTLEEIARHRPRNRSELLRISGIGPAKLAKYGAEVLEVVRSHPPP